MSAKTGRKVTELFEEVVDAISNEIKKEQEIAESSRQKMTPIYEESKE